jgi:hypothetical protein
MRAEREKTGTRDKSPMMYMYNEAVEMTLEAVEALNVMTKKDINKIRKEMKF